METEHTIRIVHNLARSGGTLICRCLGCMTGVRLLSEIHPLGHSNRHFNALNQYQCWYRDLGIENWKSTGFDESIDLIFQDCVQSGYYLVLRDWAHIDFIGPPAQRAPGFEFLLDKRLADRYQLLHCAIVRHPLEIWRSMRKMKLVIENEIDLARYLDAYRRYLEQVDKFTLIRYEDFTSAPERQIQRLCDALNLPYDPGFLHRWPSNEAITGDIHNHSRAGDSSEIRHFGIKPMEEEFKWLLECDSDYNWIIRTLDYPH